MPIPLPIGHIHMSLWSTNHSLPWIQKSHLLPCSLLWLGESKSHSSPSATSKSGIVVCLSPNKPQSVARSFGSETNLQTLVQMKHKPEWWFVFSQHSEGEGKQLWFICALQTMWHVNVANASSHGCIWIEYQFMTCQNKHLSSKRVNWKEVYLIEYKPSQWQTYVY